MQIYIAQLANFLYFMQINRAQIEKRFGFVHDPLFYNLMIATLHYPTSQHPVSSPVFPPPDTAILRCCHLRNKHHSRQIKTPGQSYPLVKGCVKVSSKI